MKINSNLKISTYLVIVCIIFNCSDKPTQPGKTPISLKIESSTFSIYSGGSLQLSAIANFADGSKSDVTTVATWSISPGRVATVSETGLFVAMMDSIGIENVRADYQGQTATVKIEISKGAVSLVILPSITTISAGSNLQLEAFAEFSDLTKAYITKQVTWNVTPGIAATVDSNGLVISKQGMTGQETITATFQLLSAQSVVQVQVTTESPFELITILAGSFIMGDDNGQPNEKPAHEVYLDAYQIGTYEVTNKQYVDYLNQALALGDIMVSSGIVTGRKGPFAFLYYFRFQGSREFPDVFIEYIESEPETFGFRVVPGYENYPVVRVNWYGAAAFCSFYGFRLPTEAEWEKASRGGSQLQYGTADGTINHDLANYYGTGGRDIYDGLAPVGSFPENPFGIYDLCGNAAEYVFDYYDAEYYSNSPSKNPIGPGPAQPIGMLPDKIALWRGGSWVFQGMFCRSAFRGVIPDHIKPSYLTQSCVGFRVARSLP